MNDPVDEIDRIFADLDRDLHYQKAHDTIKDLVTNLDLTNREKVGFSTELNELSNMLTKLEEKRLQIAAFGMVGRGKSSVLNALIGEDVFKTGVIHGVTRTSEHRRWELPEDSSFTIELIDTPGIDEVEGSIREEIAIKTAEIADIILFIITGDLTQVELTAISQLRDLDKPLLLVFNKIDQYSLNDRQELVNKICEERLKGIIDREDIIMVAAAPIINRLVKEDRGEGKVIKEKGPPNIEPLRTKVKEKLLLEGKSIMAVNSLLTATRLERKLIQHKINHRSRPADDIIWQTVITKSAAIALNPIMIADILGGTVIDIAMIVSLSKLYGIPLTKSGATDVFRNLAVGMGGLTATEMFASLGLSSLKGLITFLSPATGGLSLAPYTTIAVTQGAIAGVLTYYIGQGTKIYLENGASWSVNSPQGIMKGVIQSLDNQGIFNRIKNELTKIRG